MAEKPEFLQLETGDDATSVRDRLSFLRGKRVLIVWPEEGTALTRKLDLVLIQREASRLAIRFAIVTHDAEVMKHAQELEISAFETIGASGRARWKRGRAKAFVGRAQRPQVDPLAEELLLDMKPVESRRARDPDDEPYNPRSPLIPILIVAVLLIAAAVIAGLLVPSATVAISPARQQIPVETTVIADPNATTVDVDSRLIPAVTLRVEVEDSGTIPTSGSKTLSDAAATGSVVFINQTNRAVDIPLDTRLMTSAGTPILFHTTTAASAPAQVGGQVEVPIAALPASSGGVGNVEANLINTIVGPLADSLTVRNLQPTTGGSSPSRKAVSQDDYDRLLATLRQQLQSRAYLGMDAQRTAAQTIILESIRITEERDDWKQWSAAIGDETDTLSLTMRARVEAQAVDENLAQQVVLAMLTSQAPPGRALVPESLNYQCCTVQGIDPTGRIALAISGSGIFSARVASGQIQEKLAGRSLPDAISYLVSTVDLQQGQTPTISLSPDWFGRLPFLPMRIDVHVEDRTP